MPDHRELSGWGEIATYLRISIRAAQMREKESGLPIHRTPGAKGRVWAITDELDEWRNGGLGLKDPEPLAEPQAEIPTVEGPRKDLWSRLHSGLGKHSLVISLSLAMVLIGAILVVSTFWQRRGIPATYETVFKTLIVKDDQGRELFRHTFPFSFSPTQKDSTIASRMWAVDDVDGDGQPEVVFAYNPQTDPGESMGQKHEVLCFSARGRVKWQFPVGRPSITDNSGDQYFPPFVIAGLKIVPGLKPGLDRIVISSFHHMNAPNQVAVLDGHGKLIGEYWHPGWLPLMGVADLDHDGKSKILLAGVNNGEHAATLIAFDPNHVSGTATNLSDPRFGFGSLPKGSEKNVALFPRTCVARSGQKKRPYNLAYDLHITNDRLFVWVTEMIDDAQPTPVIYELDYNFNVLSASPSTKLQWAHADMEKAGILKHPMSSEDIDDIAKRVIIRRAF